MRYMILVEAAAESGTAPVASLLTEMIDYHEQLAKAGALLDGATFKPDAKVLRSRNDDVCDVIGGSLAGTGTPYAGYILIQAKTREEALEWARRFPSPASGQPARLEVRQVDDPDAATLSVPARYQIPVRHVSIPASVVRRGIASPNPTEKEGAS